MKLIFSVMVLGTLSLTGCAHKGHSHHEGHHGKAKCCSEKKDCKSGSCKLEKGDKKKSCCSKAKKK